MEFPFKTLEITGKSSGKSSGKTRDKVLELLSDRSEITIPEIAEIIGLSTRAVEKHIKKFQDEEILKRIGSRKSGKWKILE